MPINAKQTLRVTVATCTIAGLASGAAAQAVGPVHRITHNSIFAGCTADHVSQQPGTNFPATEIEPNLALDPATPDHVLVGVQQDRWSNGGARGLRTEYSLDGGITWSASNTPNVTLCQVGPWPRSSDPWVSFGGGSIAYFSSLVTEELADPNLFGHNGQTVSRSTDGGRTWGPPTTLIDTPATPAAQPQRLNDKNAVTADPDSPSRAYVVWDQLSSFTPGFGEVDAAPAGGANPGGGHPDGLTITRRLRDQARARVLSKVGQAAAPAAAYPVFVTGPVWFARTLTGGQTWERSHIIYDPGANNQTIANQVVVLPHGQIADFFTQQNDLTGADQIGLVLSGDFGTTWSGPILSLDIVNDTALTPNTQQAIRSADILFSVATDNTNGVIYLVWQDTRFSGVNEIAFAFSPDGGHSWSTPARINQTPARPLTPLFQQAIIPSVTAAADGTVTITYYDFRADLPGSTTDLADYWAVFCNPITSSDACTSTADWSNEMRLTPASFDLNNAPVASGHFLGDYMGLKARGHTVWTVFGVATEPNQTDLLARRITLPVAVAAH